MADARYTWVESLLPAAIELHDALPTTPAAVAREEERQAAEPVEVPERLRTPPEPRRDRCTWTENETGQWDTECSHCFELSDSGGPLAHGMRFCCYCGGRLAEVPWLYTSDDEDLEPLPCALCEGSGAIGELVRCELCRGTGKAAP